MYAATTSNATRYAGTATSRALRIEAMPVSAWHLATVAQVIKPTKGFNDPAHHRRLPGPQR